MNLALDRANRDILSYLFSVLKERGLLYDPINFPIDVDEYELPYSMMILHPLQHGRLYRDFHEFVRGEIDHIPTQAEIGPEPEVERQREMEMERQREMAQQRQHTIDDILTILGQQGHLIARRVRHAVNSNIIPRRLDTIVCKLGMDMISQDSFDSQFLNALQQQRYQQAKKGTIPDTILGFIDNNTGHVLCVVKEQELAYWNSKRYTYKGVIANNRVEYDVNRSNQENHLFFMNLSLWQGHFFLRANIDNVVNSNTNIFLVVKTNKKFYDVNSHIEVSTFHNVDRDGDYIHIIIPIE